MLLVGVLVRIRMFVLIIYWGLMLIWFCNVVLILIKYCFLIVIFFDIMMWEVMNMWFVIEE